MKLKKLVITGFGPYALRQELDFEKNLKDKNMFVITGNTGAGKTTIFDAINFALYGEANGSDREGKSLRSDFAESETPTEVELWFSLRDKDYYVKRTPAYIKPKKRGEGFVENKPTAEIKIAEDKIITGTKEVTKEVESILGITTEQFKQLVMIPQGEFKRLLNAKSDEKEEIFRKIFGTEIFQSIQKQIKEQANVLERKVREVQRDRLNKIKSFNCKEKQEELFRLINADEPNIELLMKGFQEFIKEDTDELNNLEINIKEIEKLIKEISNSIALGEANNNKFTVLQKNKSELDKLKAQIEDFQNKKIKADNGKKALNVKNQEDIYNDKINASNKLDEEIEKINKKIIRYKEKYTKDETLFKDQQTREDEKNQLIKDLEENKRLKHKVSEYEISKSNVESLEKKVKSIKERINEIGLHINENDNKIDTFNKELEEIKKCKEKKALLEVEQINYANKNDKLKKLINDINLWANENERHKKEVNNFNNIEKSFQETKEKYEMLEDKFRKNQAGILASNLKEGEECPVCGSPSHPKLAKLENKEITEAAVKKSKDLFEKSRIEKDKKLNELTDINSTLKSIKANSIDAVYIEFFNKDIVDEVNVISEEVSSLFEDTKSKIKEYNEKINDLNYMIHEENEKYENRELLQKNNQELRGELETINADHVLQEGSLSAAKNTLEIIEKDFKGEIKTVAELNKITAAINDKLLNMKKDYEQCEREFNLTKEILAEELGRQKTTMEMKEKANKEVIKVKELFQLSIKEAEFKDYEEYKVSILTEEKIKNIEKEINDFNINLAGAEKVYEASLKDIEGLSLVDLEILKNNLANQNSVLENLTKEKMIIFSRINNNGSILESCKEFNKQIEKDEKEYEIVGKLSNVINGENSKKISFERYVLAAYFEDIITAANIRFYKMTAGRFELLRKQEAGDKRKGQGLELEVFDNYTGKARDVKTLSGGESFKASLSMALGLADIVQAYSGGIQLDTMFIDEGFGTLDPESLDSAVECLMDLQKDGRLVGIISHVPELKERIDARLEVRASNKGSLAEFR